ncbi:MAG: methyl-accepting chemotaxis sensory transducer [Rhodocyclaceae bacterium]|nr:methyl-accepting chemotaxis sensory transducer [Rhodocyclaceae bacterium]
MLLSSTSLRHRLRWINVATALVLACVIVFTLTNLHDLQRTFARYQERVGAARLLVEVKAAALAASRTDPIPMESGDKIRGADREVQAMLQEIARRAGSAAEREKLAAMEKTWQDYIRQFESAITIAAQSPMDAMSIPEAIYQTLLQPMTADIDALLAHNRTEAEDAEREFQATLDRILWLVVAPLLLAGGVIIAFQLAFGGHLKKRVGEFTERVDVLYNGDLRTRLPEGRDELGEVGARMNTFIGRFGEIFGEVGNVSAEVTRASRRVDEMTNAVNQNSRIQSEKLEHVQDAIDELGTLIDRLVDNARSVESALAEARGAVERGNATGRQAVDTMLAMESDVDRSVAAINDQGKAIGQISGVSRIIRDIAEQTNLLALNAAIEAARAGEAGRGFAVVADEVRKLSERTQGSTRDIETLLEQVNARTGIVEETMDRVRSAAKEGVAFGQDVRHMLDLIAQAVQTVAARMEEISLATHRQAEASREVIGHVEAVADIAAATTADIVSTHAEVKGLSSLSENLNGAVGRFTWA